MILEQQISIRNPVIWVTSEEYTRVLDEVIRIAPDDAKVFYLDGIDGLMNYADGTWKPWIVDFGPEYGYQVVKDLKGAIAEVIEQKGTFIIPNAHLIIDKLYEVIDALYSRYRNAFYEDSVEELPAQFILVSHDSNVPAEISRHTMQVEVPLPDATKLEAILDTLFARRNYAGEANLIVRAGRGLSEGQFINACLDSLSIDGRTIDAEKVNAVKHAMLKKGGLLEVRKPSITISQIGGLDNLKRLISTCAYLWKNPEAAAAAGVVPIRRILLVGVPGSGKSAMAEAAADALGLELGKTGVAQAMNKYVGESEANMRRVWRQVRDLAPIALWADEFGRDMSGAASSGSVDGGTTDRVHGEFLTGLQELPDNVFFIAAANRISELPPEMLRQDRFDKIMFVGFPSFGEREEIFRIHLGEEATSYDTSALARATPFFTGAEIKGLLTQTRFNVFGRDYSKMTTEDIIREAPALKNRIWVNRREEMLAMYSQAMTEWEFASSDQEREAERVLSAGRGTANVQSGVPARRPSAAFK